MARGRKRTTLVAGGPGRPASLACCLAGRRPAAGRGGSPRGRGRALASSQQRWQPPASTCTARTLALCASPGRAWLAGSCSCGCGLGRSRRPGTSCFSCTTTPSAPASSSAGASWCTRCCAATCRARSGPGRSWSSSSEATAGRGGCGWPQRSLASCGAPWRRPSASLAGRTTVSALRSNRSLRAPGGRWCMPPTWTRVRWSARGRSGRPPPSQ
mmetsp:Transcript_188/g.552  ORF Transcript_188/g.552 Transcript_188/m.552 type:complete len:214 (-) Transcript_188:416-1057(-)